MGHEQVLVHSVATDNGAEEVVVILAIQQGGEIGHTIFTNDAEGETRGCGSAAVGKRRNLNTLWRATFADKPVDARAGERGVHPGAIELDGAGRVAAGEIAGEKQRLFDTFGEEVERMRIRVRAEPCCLK